MKNLKGSLILLTAAFIWGTAFVAQTSGAESVGTFTFNMSRSFVASAFLGIVIAVRDRIGYTRLKVPGDRQERKPQTDGWPIRGGILCGVILFAAMGFQQGGISLYPEGAAASGRAGFLTATYVVMVALIAQFKGKKLNKFVAASVIGTVGGMYLLCMSGGFSGIYTGDILLLLCAVCYTGHILTVDRYSKVDSFKLSCVQFLTCGVLSAVLCVALETVLMEDIIQALVPILYAGVMSGGVAYTLQMVGQKYAEPAVASIVMSLESVFAVLAGGLILHEVLSVRELMGCVLVFISVMLAQIPGFKKQKS